MRFETRVIPVEGISEVPGIAGDLAEDLAHNLEDMEARRQRAELQLLNVATGLAVTLVCCAWIAIALD